MLKTYLPIIVMGILGMLGYINEASFISWVNIDTSDSENSPVFYYSPNATFTRNTYSEVPLNRIISLTPDLMTLDGHPIRALFNVKIHLPNNKLAFVREVFSTPAIIAYTNDDCSEIRITEAYQSEISADDTCFILYTRCDGWQGKIDKGSKALRSPELCFQR